jgi:hypothetical protein
VLLGDSGYRCDNILLTPVLRPSNPAEEAYNSSQKQTRNCIERAIGVLKRRFPCIASGLRCKLDTSLTIIIAVCVLHNISKVYGDAEFFYDVEGWEEEIDEGVQYDLAVGQDTAAGIAFRRRVITNHFQ